ncbi:MAG: hypothetical protein AB7I19_18115 [Planctomycetota bacterium]
MLHRSLPLARALVAGILAVLVIAGAPATQNSLPKEDVIDVPAITDGLCVHNLFQSNMVVQRDRPIAIWGFAAPRETIVVSLGDESRTVTAAEDRSWRVQLPARSASSKPITITVASSTKTIELHNVLVGDVWLLGGQSNMEFPLERVDNGDLEIVSARYDGIRILTVPAQNGPEPKLGFPRLHEWSGWFGQHFRKGDWDVCSPAIARDLSAIGYVFARRIHMASQVPIGIIDVSRGGTTVETWTPIATLRRIDTPAVRSLLAEWDAKVAAWDPGADLAARVADFERRVKDRQTKGEAIPADWQRPTDLQPGPALDMNRPGNCFASMMAPLAGLAVKGAIFHQGYNNALGDIANATLYRTILREMIAAWRTNFADPQMAFGIIALCTDGDPQTLDNYCEKMLDAGILIREAQYQTFVTMRSEGDTQIGFASSYDQRRSWYHPQQKVPVGERIARWALATQYGLQREIRWLPPQITSMDVEPGRLVLHFDRAVAPPDQKAKIEGFAVAGADRHFHPADAQWLVSGHDARNQPQIDRSALVLSSGMVESPIHFRFAWGRNPMGNLQSADHTDLPLATQRSDDWPMESVPLGVLTEDSGRDGRLARAERAKLLTALRQDDLHRRLAEARALLEKHPDNHSADRR